MRKNLYLKASGIILSLITPLLFFVGTTNAAPKPSKLDSYYKWLQGDWGQMGEDGAAHALRGCTVESTTPDELRENLKGQYGLDIGFFYHGVISFGVKNDNLFVISNYGSSDLMMKPAYNNFRKSAYAQLTLTPGVDAKGFVTFNFDKDIPSLAGLRTIIPLTNHSFKLVVKADDPNLHPPAYYFTRCGNS